MDKYKWTIKKQRREDKKEGKWTEEKGGREEWTIEKQRENRKMGKRLLIKKSVSSNIYKINRKGGNEYLNRERIKKN